MKSVALIQMCVETPCGKHLDSSKINVVVKSDVTGANVLIVWYH